MKLMPKKEKLAVLLTRWLQTVNSLKANESAVFMRCEVPYNLFALEDVCKIRIDST